MKPQPLVKFLSTCLLSSAILFSSCTKDNTDVYVYPVNPNPGQAATVMNLELTSTTSSFDYNKLNVDIQSIQYNTSNEPGIIDGWENVNLEVTGTINMLSLANGNSIRLNTDMLPGNVKQLRIQLGDHNSIQIGDTTRNLTIAPQLKETGLVIFTDIQTNVMYANSLWLNFDATHSIVHDANEDVYTLAPIIYPFDVTTTGSIEGFISPADAKPFIKLQTDQSSRNVLMNTNTVADENANGYFKIIGLPEGVYQVDMLAGDGTNRNKTLVMIAVKAGETTNVGSNVLE